MNIAAFDNISVLSAEEFSDLMTLKMNVSLLEKMPGGREACATNKPFDLIHVVEDVYLARGKIGTLALESRTCNKCAMAPYVCHLNRKGQELREMPCQINFTGENDGYVAIRAQTVSTPTNGKKKDYVPDTPENFDFSPENWNSVKTMIGL